VERVLALESIQPLLVVRHPKFLPDDRRFRGLGRSTELGLGGRRRVVTGMAVQKYRYRQQADHESDCRQQQMPVAHVAIEVAEELRGSDALHGVGLVVAIELEVVVDEEVDPNVGLADGGPAGVAPPVTP
jgi:hypothetical protein